MGLSRVKSVMFVSSGAVVGQGVIILTLPIITRLYSPDTFGLYAVFVSSVGMFSSIIALHYELAIPLPKGDAEAKRVLTLALLVAFSLSLLIGILVFAFSDYIFFVLKSEALEPYAWMFVVVLALNGWLVTLRYWTIRKKAFHSLALSTGSQGIGQATPQMIAGAFGWGIIGLLLGQVGGLVAGLWPTLRRLPRHMFSVRQKWTRARLMIVAKKYRKFPMITTWSSLINALSVNLPVLMLSVFFGAAVTGFFALSYRILQLPTRLIGESVAQVFFSMAADANRTADLARVTRRVFRGMFSFALPTFAILGYVAPELVALVFGKTWAVAGWYSQLLMPWIFFAFLSSTLSVLVSVLHKQAQELLFQGAYLGCILLSLAVGSIFGSTAAIALLGILGGLFLLLKVFWLLSIAGVSTKESAVFCLRESGGVALVVLGLYVGKPQLSSDLILIGVAVLTLAGMHGLNYRVRNVYGIRS